MLGRIGILIMLALFVQGCATTANNSTQLQSRIAELEQESSSKDEEIKELQYNIKDLTFEIDRLKNRPTPSAPRVQTQTSGSATDDRIIRVDVDPKQVQSALKSAGYYKGEIDGKVGGQTKEAISRFQKDRGLEADGILGRKTWQELNKSAQ